MGSRREHPFHIYRCGRAGTKDTAQITIWSGDYTSSPIVLQVDRTYLTYGNHQAHDN
jgi:hypothetical protein